MAVDPWIRNLLFELWSRDNGDTKVLKAFRKHLGTEYEALHAEYVAYRRDELLTIVQADFDAQKDPGLDQLALNVLDDAEVTNFSYRSWLFSKLREGRPIPPPPEPPE
jgi:hypothetical protein